MNTDEQILQIRKRMEAELQQKKEREENENEIEQSIFRGTVNILGNEVAFERREIDEFGISLLLPNDFQMLEKEVYSLMYPSAEGPKHVLTSQEGYMSVSFKLNNNTIPKEKLNDFVKLSKTLLEAGNSRVKVIKTGEVIQDEMQIGVIEYISNVLDGVAYNIMGFLPLKKGILLICILFKNSNKKRLCPVGKEILQSILISEEEQNEH